MTADIAISTPGQKSIEVEASRVKVAEQDLYGALWRSFNFAGNYNFERLMALGMVQVMVPIFRSLKFTPEQLREGYSRHLVFYNTHPYFGALIMGTMVAMEEAKANGENITPETINGLKIAMMGPFAGVGDSLFWGTIHPIILAISANLALQGNFLGAIAAFMIGILAVLGHYFGFFWGYRGGIDIVRQLHVSQLLEKVTLGARIVAMTVAGVMVATLINIKTPLVLFKTEAENSGVVIQNILDQIMPKLLPLGALFLVYWLLKKKLSAIWVMLILMALTILGTTLGWLG